MRGASFLRAETCKGLSQFDSAEDSSLLKACLHRAQFLARHAGLTGTRTMRIRAGTTYLHGPSTNTIGTSVCFIRAVPKIKRNMNGA